MLSGKPCRILLVEPEQVLAEITQFRLELLGYQVDAIDSGEKALAAIEKQKPDVIICDLTLPGMSGLELIERLASAQETSRIPIMAISFEADIESVQRAHKTGVVDYLVAPYQPTVMEEKVAKLAIRATQATLAATR